jgi:hypothetical protein
VSFRKFSFWCPTRFPYQMMFDTTSTTSGVGTVFRLLTDFFRLFNYEFWPSLCKIARSSVILLLPLSFRSTLVHLRLLVGIVLLNLLFSVLCFVDHCLSFWFFFWPLYCVSFKLQHLVTLLVSSIFSFLLRGFLWAIFSCFNQLPLSLQMLYSKLFVIWLVCNCWILWRDITIIIKNREPGVVIRQVNNTIISDIENKCDAWLMQDLLKGLVR